MADFQVAAAGRRESDPRRIAACHLLRLASRIDPRQFGFEKKPKERNG
jgi:hypothetical protein